MFVMFCYKQLIYPLTAMTLLASITIAVTYPSQAQRPRGQRSVAPRPTASVVQAEANYTLGGGDRIRIDVFEEPQLGGELQVPLGGLITLPLIGGISIQGLTTEQASRAIERRYAPYLKRPVVTVTLLSARPVNVLVSGEVNNPGSYSITLTQGQGYQSGVQYPTAIQAIKLAGGFTLTADIRRIQLRRPQTSGRDRTIDIDFWKFLQAGDRGQDAILRDGDTIFVPTAANLSVGETRLIASAGLIGDPEKARTVAVVGEVFRPGSYVVVGGGTAAEPRNLGLPTVIRAIELAGGITSLADIRSIELRRATRAGTQQIISLNLWQLLQTGDLRQNAVLQDGDTIVVPTATDVNPAEAEQLATASFAPANIQVTVIGEVKTPGSLRVAPNTTLNQALLVAGGFNNARAHRDTVELIRLNSNGSVSRRSVRVDMSQGINEQTNPQLRNNDVIVVRRSGIARIADTVDTVLTPATRGNQLFNIPLTILEIFRRL
ncbi:SLBB domain-containing protein [Aerosakkonema sp. BLCC-F183]|uniref:SLBB domain-containing protein n=2 Tax=Aerosakkonema TaxID=1246629 RepID=UPI0035BBF738